MLQIKTAVQILQHKNFLCFPTKEKKSACIHTSSSSKAWNIFGIENYLANIQRYLSVKAKNPTKNVITNCNINTAYQVTEII